jgi:hypothetical protein
VELKGEVAIDARLKIGLNDVKVTGGTGSVQGPTEGHRCGLPVGVHVKFMAT